MGNSHRDNHNARKKAVARGKDAFALKHERREEQPKCTVCGKQARPKVLVAGICPRCLSRP